MVDAAMVIRNPCPAPAATVDPAASAETITMP